MKIKKVLGLKLSFVHEELAKCHGYRDFYAVVKSTAEAKNVQSTNGVPFLAEEEIESWVKQLEEVFGMDVLAAFDQRSHAEWFSWICASSQVPMDHINTEITPVSNSLRLNEAHDVSKPMPPVIYRKRKKIEFP